MLSQVRLKWTHPWVCLAFLRFLKMQKALLYWMMMQSCLTADHLGMKCGFSPSIFKYWRLCFQQGWQTRSFYRTLFYEVLLNNPKFEGTKWGQAVEMAYGMGGASFGGPVLHQDGHLGSCVDSGRCPHCRVDFSFCWGFGLPRVPMPLQSSCHSKDKARLHA